MFDETAFVDKLKKEIDNCKKKFTQEDLCFMIYSGYHIASQKTVSEKTQATVEVLACLEGFRDYIIEFYLMRNDKLRLSSLEGVSLKQNIKYIGRSIELTSELASVLGKHDWKEHVAPIREATKRRPLIRELKIKESVYFPINSIGVLAISRKGHKPITTHDKELIYYFLKIDLAPSLALAMDNEANIERAIRDQMTGLFNHAFFQHRLREESALMQRGSERPLTLIMIDVDYFKHYNDTNGHPKGDIVLKEIANIIKKKTRKDIDISARYGGEEFAVLMPNTFITDANIKAEAIRKEIEKTKFANGESQPGKKITISVGVANIPMHALNGENLVEAADAALYYSKENGKNKVTVYSKEEIKSKK